MKCLKFAAVSFAMVLSSAQAFAGQGVFGTWKFPQVDAGPLTINATLSVAQDSVSSSVTCTANGQTVTLSVSAPATVSENTITVTGSANQEVTSPISCNVSLSPASMNYSVSADDSTLTLSQDGQSIALPRQ